MVRASAQAVAGDVKEVGDRVVEGQEALNLAGRFELLHLPLASAGRLMGVLGAVVQPLVLAMLARSRPSYWALDALSA